MRRLLPLAALTFAALPAIGYAADVDGCPTADSLVFTPAYDAKSAALTYKDLIASGGDVVRCSVAFSLANGAAPGTITVYSADFRGSMFITKDGEQASVDTANNGIHDGQDFTGSTDEDYTISRVVATHDGKVTTTGTVDMTGTTSGADDEGSIDSADFGEIGRITLPTDESSIIAHLGASASLLTSGQPISGDNSFTFFGGVGSAMLGANGQYQLGDGLSLLGGVAYVQQSYATASVQGVIGGVAVRYLVPGVTSFRPFAEGGAQLGGLGLTFTDPGKTSTAAGLGSVYARGGVETDIVPGTTASLSGTVEESFLGVKGYSLSNAPFSATIADQTGRFTVAKVEAGIKSQLTDTIDVSGNLGAGVLIGHDEVKVAVGGLGTIGQKPPTQLFVDYGARIGLALAPTSRLEGFVQGSTTADLGTHVQVGAAFTQKF